MKKNLFFTIIASLFIITSCNREEESLPQRLHANGKSEVIITGEGMKSTRAANGRIEFTGGYATGAGLYDGNDIALVEAVPYEGYQLKKFEGGPIGKAFTFMGKSNYKFGIDNQDWKFGVTFKKEYRINLTAGEGGTVSGGGIVLEDDDCTITATPNEGYAFAGWYDGNNMISDLANYTFTITGNRDLQARFKYNRIAVNLKISLAFRNSGNGNILPLTWYAQSMRLVDDFSGKLQIIINGEDASQPTRMPDNIFVPYYPITLDVRNNTAPIQLQGYYSGDDGTCKKVATSMIFIYDGIKICELDLSRLPRVTTSSALAHIMMLGNKSQFDNCKKYLMENCTIQISPKTY